MTWNGIARAGHIEAVKLDGLDGVVHLAGENIGARWTATRKKAIWESRAIGTRFLCETLTQRLHRPPRVLICASAVGIYGNRGDEVLAWESRLPPPHRLAMSLALRLPPFADPESQIAAVREVLAEIGASHVPELVVLNKVDVASAEAVARLRRREPHSVVVSAVTGEGIADLLGRLERDLPHPEIEVDVLVPYAQGRLVGPGPRRGRGALGGAHGGRSSLRARVGPRPCSGARDVRPGRSEITG